MKYSEARYGRIFILRLEDRDVMHEEIERFAREKSISAAALLIVGGADQGSRLVVGPEEGRASPVVPLEHLLENVHELAGVGTIFPDDRGNPVLHLHAACGRKESSITGCVRRGVKVWQIMEAILLELTDASAVRTMDAATGFKLLTLPAP
jgi:predicted DNA-binding protein with PD1-like motif